MSYLVYGDMLSGNCYKIKLLLTLLGLEHSWQHVDILAGETRQEDFLAKNPNGRIPLLQLPDGEHLAESNAILNYLAEGTAFLPRAGLPRARVLQWQFFEQYSHEPYIAVARYINKYLGLPDERRAEYEAKQAGGRAALTVMEQHLQGNEFFVAGGPTIADISLYAYTHVADEGGFDLQPYPALRDWLARIEALPGYIVMSRENSHLQG